MSILNKYKQHPLKLVLNRTNIMDIVISEDNTINNNAANSNENLVAYIDAQLVEDIDVVTSLDKYYYKEWKSNVEDINLPDLILTGYDNKLLNIDIDYSEVDLKIEKGDKLLTLYRVSETNDDLSLSEEGIVFNGGFLQGFYRLYGFPYETLPNYIENNEWNLEFKIIPHTQSDDEAIFFYMGTRAENKFANFYNKPNKEIKHINETTSNGVLINKDKYFEIETNNKYLENKITGYTEGYNTVSGNNAYFIFNNTNNGYTVDTIPEFYNSDEYIKPSYNIKNDLFKNAFALFITNDGEIGYRYLLNKCEDKLELNFEIEKTFKNVIKFNQLNTINVKFEIIGGETDNCGVPYGQRRMKIKIYVNGYLVFISKELDEFNFRELNEIPEKQEAVPFNISIGGGTLGLSESYLKINNELIKMEDFGYLSSFFNKRFYGILKSFKFYNCNLSINEIRNNSK